MATENIYTEPSNLDYIIIKTKPSTVEAETLYEATRKSWHAKLETAKPYKYVLSVVQGVVKEVYEVEKWSMSDEPQCPDDIMFTGHVAPDHIRNWFVDKMIPEKYRVKGMANPFLYKKLFEGEVTAEIPVPIYTEPSNIDYIIIKNKPSTFEAETLYESTRKSWHAKLETAKPYKYVLSVVQGIVKEVYEVEKWSMSDEPQCPDDIMFTGHVAPDHIRNYFVDKMIPEKYRVKGMANPFLYNKKVEGEKAAAIGETAPKECAAPACVDIQGREYKTVKIGNQEWMAENLAVTVDNEGNELTLGEDYFYPNGDEANVEKYGLLYSWDVAMRIAPKGWKVPTADDWNELKDFCEKHFTADDEDGIGASIALAGSEGWDDYPEDETDYANATGFSAYPAGASDNNGEAFSFGFLSEFWSSTMLNRYVPYAFALNGDFEYMWLDEDDEDENENLFFSVRCLY